MVGTHHQGLGLSEDNLSLSDVSASHHVPSNMLIIMDTVWITDQGLRVMVECSVVGTTIFSATLSTGEAGVISTDEALSTLSTLSTHYVSLE